MDRKFLEGKGLEKDVIDEIMAEHGKAVQAAKPSEDYETLKKDKETLSQQITDLNESLTTAHEEKSTFEASIEALNNEVSSYKTKDLKTRIAMEHKIPFELAGRLSGETEDEIKADAEALSKLIVQKPTLPLGSTEPEFEEEKKYSNQSRIIKEQYQSE